MSAQKPRPSSASVPRYWPGKAPSNYQQHHTNSDDDDEEDGQHHQSDSEPNSAGKKNRSLHVNKSLGFATAQSKPLFKVIDQPNPLPNQDTDDPRIRRLAALTSRSTSRRNRRSSSDEDEQLSKPMTEQQARLEQANRRLLLEQQLLDSSSLVPASSPEEDESSEGEEGSSDEESSSDNSLVINPVFVPKFQRQQPIHHETSSSKTQRKQESRAMVEHEIIQGSIKVQEPKQVNDTDGVDPETEYSDWKAREMSRLLRAYTARNAPETDDDQERVVEPKPKSKVQFMQQYYHKGAFYNDESLAQLDVHSPRPDQFNVQNMPKVMQRRKWGLKGDTKWTHLVNEDTSVKKTLDLFGTPDHGKRRGGMGDLDLPTWKRRRG